MGKRHNTLSDDIFRNSKYVKTLEKELGIDNFRKEYKEQYDIMLNIYKTFILINNIIFADSNKSINDKIFEIELELEKCLFGSNDNDSEKYQYSTRTIKGLLDSNSRILFNKFIEWYDYLMNINKLDQVKQDVEELMNKLEYVGFDNVIKGKIEYKKNKDSNYKIFISKFNNLYAENKAFLDQYKQDYNNTYGIDLSDNEMLELAFIYDMVASANNGLAYFYSSEDISNYNLSEKSSYKDYYSAYLSALNIDFCDNTLFEENTEIFMQRCFKTIKRIEKQGKDVSLNKFIANFDYYYFRENFRIIANKPDTIKIKNDLLNKIVKDLIEIYNLIENEEEIENNYQLAFDKVQNIIDRNKNFFERLS